MKKVYISLLLILSASFSQAQVTNSNFEDWLGGLPVGWITSYDSLPGSVIESDSAHSGSSALQLKVVSHNGGPAAGFAYTNNFSTGTHNPNVPYTLYGWYMLNTPGGDKARIDIEVSNNSTIVGTASMPLVATYPYKQFSVDIDYTGSFSTIDFSNYRFTLEPADGDTLHPGTSFIVDDLSFSQASGLPDFSAINGLTLETVYPNTLNGNIDIVYNIPAGGTASLMVYDCLGRTQQLLLHDNLTPGKYKSRMHTNELAAGMYYCRLMINNKVLSVPVMVSK